MPDKITRLEFRREFNHLRRVVLACFALLLCINVGGWWKSEHDSCIRNTPVRVRLHLPALHCNRILPEAPHYRPVP
jgi:hypothetical protein